MFHRLSIIIHSFILRVARGGEPAACHGGRWEAQRQGGDPQGAMGTATATARRVAEEKWRISHEISWESMVI